MRQIRLHGFTLIELMIVVVIIGIIAAIAYPSYTKYVVQTRRSDAQIALTRAATQQEKFYSDCGYYATTLLGTRSCGSGGADGTGAGQANAVLGYDPASALSPDRHYLVTLATNNIAASCAAAGGPCNGLGGAALTQCTARCGFTLVANPNGAGTSGRQANNGGLRIDSTGRKNWDKANNNSWSATWTDK